MSINTPLIHTASFSKMIGNEYVLTDEKSLQHYAQDWSKLYQVKASIVLRPKNTSEVSTIMAYANQHQLAIIPSGGRTGLSGGAVATQNEIILSLERLNQITDFNATDLTVSCGAGVITEQLQIYANDEHLYYPVDFASAGSSQIGGNIATNAGGIKVLKYGLTRNWVLGLTVVLASGEILTLNHGLIKNATGYDFRHLLIGSEGTLGVITEAVMQLTQPPMNLTVMLLALHSLADIAPLMLHFQSTLDLHAFEFFSQAALEKVMLHRKLSSPFNETYPYYVLIEFDSISDACMEKALTLFEKALENEWLCDGIISQSHEQNRSLWVYREGISESIAHYPPYKNDISVKPSQIHDFLNKVDDFVNKNYPRFETIWFGHIGDGNLHLNILKPSDCSLSDFKQHCAKANPFIFEFLKSFNGSISAEHGVGLLKKKYLSYTKSTTEIDWMQSIKHLFDPNGILNPGKLF
jgi:FAD/FMN-containing dehydrogenase